MSDGKGCPEDDKDQTDPVTSSSSNDDPDETPTTATPEQPEMPESMNEQDSSDPSSGDANATSASNPESDQARWARIEQNLSDMKRRLDKQSKLLRRVQLLLEETQTSSTSSPQFVTPDPNPNPGPHPSSRPIAIANRRNLFRVVTPTPQTGNGNGATNLFCANSSSSTSVEISAFGSPILSLGGPTAPKVPRTDGAPVPVSQFSWPGFMDSFANFGNILPTAIPSTNTLNIGSNFRELTIQGGDLRSRVTMRQGQVEHSPIEAEPHARVTTPLGDRDTPGELSATVEMTFAGTAPIELTPTYDVETRTVSVSLGHAGEVPLTLTFERDALRDNGSFVVHLSSLNGNDVRLTFIRRGDIIQVMAVVRSGTRCWNSGMTMGVIMGSKLIFHSCSRVTSV